VDSEPGQGTIFEVWLPRSSTSAAAAEGPDARATPARGGTESLLLVEDDPLVREMAARALRGGGYRVLVAASGAEALQLATLEVGLRLVVTDVVLPGLDGKGLADELVRRLPGLRVLFISGYEREVVGQHGVDDAGAEFLPKPFTAAALLASVRGLLDRP
jgi:CheY-like chemotaxis protein